MDVFVLFFYLVFFLSFSGTLQYVTKTARSIANITKTDSCAQFNDTGNEYPCNLVKVHSTEIKTVSDRNDCNPHAFLP